MQSIDRPCAEPTVSFLPTLRPIFCLHFEFDPPPFLSHRPRRSAVGVVRRVGLRPGGPRARRRGHHHHGHVHHDDGPRTSHAAQVGVPRGSRQEDSHLRQPQRSAQVSKNKKS